MCEKVISDLIEGVCEACAAHMWICVAEIRRMCLGCVFVFETCSALICRQAVQHV